MILLFLIVQIYKLNKYINLIYMTTNQILQLEQDLVPNINSSDLLINHDIVNQLVKFFYKCKYNYERYQKNLNVCPVNITWSRRVNPNSISSIVQRYHIVKLLPGNLAALLYKHILIEINTTLITNNFSSYIRESLRIDGLLKQQAFRYFNNKNCCSNESINYNQYHFMQLNKYIGNR
tara:strand:+ start:4500 stop:5033 length:534 start_codon:yes stop_codon:yes gene_type:complete